MPDDDAKKLDATRILFGIKDRKKAPAEMTRQSVRLTPNGTTSQQLTKEGREYLANLAKEKAAAEKARLDLARVPRVGPRAKGQERIIKRDIDQPRDKIWDKDKDFER